MGGFVGGPDHNSITTKFFTVASARDGNPGRKCSSSPPHPV
jgi:hypothetical protein